MIFSVVVPTFNRLGYLTECLQSVWSQTFADFEVVVVDDGSTDGTIDYLVGLAPKIKYVRQENLGPGLARNAGAAAAVGDYLAFLDSDDLWFPWTLSVFAEIIEKRAPSLLFGNYLDFVEVREVQRIRNAVVVDESYECFLSAYEKGHFAGAGMIAVKRTVFESIGGFATDKWNAEDHDLALRLGDAAGFVQIHAPATIAHRRHRTNAMSNTASTIAGLRRMILFERGGKYPGGPARARQRRAVISKHVRPAVLECCREENILGAWSLYASTFVWQADNLRLRFLTVAPLLMLKAALARGIKLGRSPR